MRSIRIRTRVSTYLSQRYGSRCANDHATNRTAGIIADNIVGLGEHGSQTLQSHGEELDGSLAAVVAENAEQEGGVGACRTVLVLETGQRPLGKLIELSHEAHGNAVSNVGQ